MGGGAGAGLDLAVVIPVGGGGRRAAAPRVNTSTLHKLKKVPRWAGQGVRQRVACLRARQGRRRGARQCARGARRR